MPIFSHAALGYEGQVIQVEVDLRRGIPGIDVVGLATSAVKEARDRVRVALRNSGFRFPTDRILINLAPGDIKKAGSGFDLPMALGILGGSGQVASPPFPLMALGELLLSGVVRPVNGILGAVAAGMTAGIRDFLVPAGNLREALAFEGARIWPVQTLSDCPQILDRISKGLAPQNSVEFSTLPFDEGASQPALEEQTPWDEGLPDFEELRGQPFLRRALEAAAAGGHHILLYGPPGGGKTMSARLLAGLLPSLDESGSMEVTRLWSLAGQQLPQGGLIKRPPFRSPHHTASEEGLIGGGADLRPGEVSLSHRGLLFLDEALEFPKHILQSLREPMEQGSVTIARAGRSYDFPAKFQMVLAANSCPCGHLGRENGLCLCSPDEVKRYWDRLGGALLDRLDIKIQVKPAPAVALLGPVSESTATVQKRIQRARERQRRRLSGAGCDVNSRMSGREVAAFCTLAADQSRDFQEEIQRRGLSSRRTINVLKLARTLADLEGEEELCRPHWEEALRLGDPSDGMMFWN